MPRTVCKWKFWMSSYRCDPLFVGVQCYPMKFLWVVMKNLSMCDQQSEEFPGSPTLPGDFKELDTCFGMSCLQIQIRLHIVQYSTWFLVTRANICRWTIIYDCWMVCVMFYCLQVCKKFCYPMSLGLSWTRRIKEATSPPQRMWSTVGLLTWAKGGKPRKFCPVPAYQLWGVSEGMVSHVCTSEFWNFHSGEGGFLGYETV
jgi:hypothetical protein